MTSLKAKNEARLQEELNQEQRRKGLLVLIIHHLLEHGYVSSAEKLQTETGIHFQTYEVADNIDLLNIIQEYETFFQMKFNKKPKFVRKVQSGDNKGLKRSQTENQPQRSGVTLAPIRRKTAGEENQTDENRRKDAQLRGNIGTAPVTNEEIKEAQVNEQNLDLGLVVVKKQPETRKNNSKDIKEAQKRKSEVENYKLGENEEISPMEQNIRSRLQQNQQTFDQKLLKPLPPEYSLNTELRELATIITRDIYLESPNVHWEDIVGLEEVNIYFLNIKSSQRLKSY